MPLVKFTPYERHRMRWQDCNRCDLCRQRDKVVLARGRVPAPILFIGEAPGASEDVLGRPFVGPAGHLLDQIIESALDGQYDYAITNLVGCFPRDAKDTPNHEPPKDAIEACADRVREFVCLSEADLIVCVGTLATKWVPTITKLPMRQRKMVSIIHPAAILRMDVSQQGLAIQRAIVTIEDAAAEL